VWFSSLVSRGIWGWLLGLVLTGFYVLLYFYPEFLGYNEAGKSSGLVAFFDPLSVLLNGKPATQWFLYGTVYTLAIILFGIKFIFKYRNNRYQVFRTISVIFFQLGFAFLIPEILSKLNQDLPYFSKDLKNMWPLNYYFFEDWHFNNMLNGGNLGLFILVFGLLMMFIISPILTYFFGKRWYCSWVCGCGGLAETLGDPYRQLSDKSMNAWRLERWLVHGVLVFAIVMTGFTLYAYFSSNESVLAIKTQTIQDIYGFLIGSIFAGVIGTGFYPIFGNRVWCRFGCPLAAYMGIVQRFKSRFRITTNGGQCISCGNCSTYCEQGIDVRAYAQKGENIVRASCVGCGICSAVCPRGVLKLENGPENGRINPTDILLGNNVDLMSLIKDK
jgi:polyferredoxin